eukprot:3246686-Pyramimonas_sp.AAC.1
MSSSRTSGTRPGSQGSTAEASNITTCIVTACCISSLTYERDEQCFEHHGVQQHAGDQQLDTAQRDRAGGHEAE